MIELKKITNKNVWKVAKLAVNKIQEEFVATNTESVLEAFATINEGHIAMPFAIFDGDTPVGFIMFGYDATEDEDEPEIAAHNYCIWRYMIDKSYQGKGYGRAAMKIALDYISSFPCGKAEYCWLSYDIENKKAQALYTSFGFVPNGEKCGEEIVLIKKL